MITQGTFAVQTAWIGIKFGRAASAAQVFDKNITDKKLTLTDTDNCIHMPARDTLF